MFLCCFLWLREPQPPGNSKWYSKWYSKWLSKAPGGSRNHRTLSSIHSLWVLRFVYQWVLLLRCFYCLALLVTILHSEPSYKFRHKNTSYQQLIRKPVGIVCGLLDDSCIKYDEWGVLSDEYEYGNMLMCCFCEPEWASQQCRDVTCCV